MPCRSVVAVDQFDFGMLVLRVVFGLFLAYHGYNKVFGPGGLTGTTGWFGSIGMRWPRWQARIAATTEVGAGVLLAAGLLTPLAPPAMIGVMVVAIVVAHWKVGFFIFKPNQGWEYCASIAVAAFVHRHDRARASGRSTTRSTSSWTAGAAPIVAGVVGVGGALAAARGQSYRPPKATA